MPEPLDLPVTAADIQGIRSAFAAAWEAGQRPAIKDFLDGTLQARQAELFRALLTVELHFRRQNSETIVADHYRNAFPQFSAVIDEAFSFPTLDGEAAAADSRRGVDTGPDGPRRGDEQPASLGRYTISARLGSGGFGVVYKGYDADLQREVAIKVPHRRRIQRTEDAEAYLAEARMVAGLKHPHIVTVFDIGRTEDGLCFVVSEFIAGSDLAKKISRGRLEFSESAELTAQVADALHHAHTHHLVHRDIKPGNILLDAAGKAYVADFGLALKEEDYGKGGGWCGTPAYMSPEQARGEGHRVDGRSDIFSLGVVLYELVTGRRPFQGETHQDILQQISSDEPRPPRQVDDTIPRELERICLKAMTKKASERYTTAKDLADDLRHFLQHQPEAPARASLTSASISQTGPTAPPHSPTPSDLLPLKIVPKGLRAFDANDADFFLELLPGARDRDGLPESIRFWKNRIEQHDGEQTFAVGLIYGPSGCGKSSLVKAGLLPRLVRSVTAVYIEATAADTEVRLLKGLRRQVPGLPAQLGLFDSLAALRQGRFLKAEQKVLLVLDQFEQWLHANRGAENSELVPALRQCDGGRVQALVMVRDDFWLAVSRFMQALEVRLVEGDNSRLVDLFDPLHARKVLGEFGRAYGRLPDKVGRIGNPSYKSGRIDNPSYKAGPVAEVGRIVYPSPDQNAFLDQAVAGLAQDGKVISVRLALFAEMVKGKVWTPATLKAAGGMAGVGVNFLEETFSAPTAPPEHRLHQKAAQAVLKALLPQTGADIKGNMRSHQELLAASGYAARPADFEVLLHILDSELRLITPTDPEGVADVVAADSQSAAAGPGRLKIGRHYQLTHDYLVPSLRDWLTRKQKETRRGRAELLLADRAAVWHGRPENRQLPSLWQWLSIRSLTRKTTWTAPQRKMMRKAARYHAGRALLLIAILALAGWGAYEAHGALQARGLRDRLLSAKTDEVPAIIAAMTPYRPWIDPLLRTAYDQAKADQDARRQLHLSLALFPVDPEQADYLYEQLLVAGPEELRIIRDALKTQEAILVERLQNVLLDTRVEPERRLRAACALGGCAAVPGDGDEACWPAAAPLIVDQLLAAVHKNPSHYGPLLELLRPRRLDLLPALGKVLRNHQRPEAERSFATTILADYAADQASTLANLLMDADDKQFSVLLAKLQLRGDEGLPSLGKELTKKIPRSQEPKDEKADTSADILRKSAVISLRDARVKVVVGGKALELPAKRFPVKLQAGKKYAISMTSTDVDAFVVLQDQKGAELGFDDDSAGGTNALLMYRAPRDDTYQVFAAALPPEGGGLKAEGAFTLAVVDADVFAAAAKRRAAAAKERYALARRQEEQREALAKRQANAAVALLNMNQRHQVWPLLKHTPDPRVRSYLIHRFAPLGADPADIIRRLDKEPDVAIRRALILSLGEFTDKDIPAAQRLAPTAKLKDIYRLDPDAGLHAAAEWLLRSWKHDDWLRQVNEGWRSDGEQRHKRLDGIKQQFLAPHPSVLAPRWYVNGQGQTMIVIRGDHFLMGSPVTEEGREGGPEGNIETLHRKGIRRTFAIAAHEVTVEQFLRLRPDHSYNKQYAREKDAPINNVTWYDAARYCNLLSKKENIPEKEWCYEPNEKGLYAQGMKIRPNYLHLTGYRLPTEAEWEYACRAGALTSRYYGESEELLGKYAWYTKNSLDRWMLPVGTLKPNDFGLFDMQGNALEWCQEKVFLYQVGQRGATVDDHEFPGSPGVALEKAVSNEGSRVLRGGSFLNLPRIVRSALRVWNLPTNIFGVVGFRAARTLTAE